MADKDQDLDFWVEGAGGARIGVRYRRHARAKRYILRPLADGTGLVTVPRYGTLKEARAFTQGQADWLIEQSRLALQQEQKKAVSWREGDRIWFRGQGVPIRVTGIGKGFRVAIGGSHFCMRQLPVAGDFRPEIESFMRHLAKDELSSDVARWAAQLRLKVERVTIRNQKTRWGSCSSRKTISLNWRLIQTPVWIKDYVICHELTHLRHMNHSARFWAALREAYPESDRAERWLNLLDPGFGTELAPKSVWWPKGD